MEIGEESRSLHLWCGAGGLAYYPREGYEAALDRYLDRCQQAQVGVLRFYFGYAHHGPTVFRLAHAHSREELASFDLLGGLDPFEPIIAGAKSRGMRAVGYTSPNYQGGLQPNPHSAVGEKLPILYLSDLAHQHPAAWAVDRDGKGCLERDGFVLLKLDSSAARDHLGPDLAGLALNKGMDALELEWLCGAGPASPYLPSGAAGREAVTGFVRRLRSELAPGIALSVSVPADLDRALAWHYEWPTWAAEGLVASVILRELGPSTGQLAEQVGSARRLCAPSATLVAQLDPWRYQELRNPERLLAAGKRALESGADQVGVYRADTVETEMLWPALAQLGDKIH